jgi:hypothetical protein
MAVEVRELVYHTSPQLRRVVTDLIYGRPRGTAARDPFNAVIFGSPELENIPVGSGVVITGQSERVQARDRAFSDRLLATLQKDIPAQQKAAEILADTAAVDVPTETEQKEIKAKTITAAAPIALAGKIADIDKVQQQIESSRQLVPITIQVKTAEAERTRAEAAKRRAEAESLFNLQAVEAERTAAEAEFLRARAAAEALQPRTFDLATGGLDFFSKQVLARELVRVAAGERPFFAPVERRRRVITSF